MTASVRVDARPHATPDAIVHAPRPRAQPQGRLAHHPARQARRRHRALRQRQVHARLRRDLRRGTAALPRDVERLRAPVPPHPATARRGDRPRGPALDRPRAAHDARRPHLHGGDGHRGRPLPAPALRQGRHAALPGLRHGHRGHRRAHDPRPHRRARRARDGAVAGHPRAQGHPPRRVHPGHARGLPRGLRRRRPRRDRASAEPRAQQGTHHRARGRRGRPEHLRHGAPAGRPAAR